MRYFLYLAPGYMHDYSVYEDGQDRAIMCELGADPRFLNRAEPGDFYEVGRDRVLIRMGRNWYHELEDEDRAVAAQKGGPDKAG